MKKIQLLAMVATFFVSYSYGQYGPNVAAGVTVNRSNSNLDADSYLVDGDTDNRCAIDASSGWYALDLGEGNEKTVTQYVIYRYGGGAYPYDWTFEGSNNNTDWTILHTVENAAFDALPVSYAYEFENQNGYRYYRLNITRANADYIAINELELMESVITSDPDPEPDPEPDQETPTAIHDKISSGYNFYPNPAADYIVVDTPIENNTAAEIFNLSGKMVLKTTIQNKRIDLNELLPGVYVVKIGDGYAKFLKK